MFQELLENVNVWKVGVGVQNDAGDLEHRYQQTLKVRGTLDLRWFAEMMGYKQTSLKGLAEEALGATKYTHQTGQRWDAAELSMDQIMYASTDAILGVALFFHMFHKLISQVRILDSLISPRLNVERFLIYLPTFRASNPLAYLFTPDKICQELQSHS